MESLHTLTFLSKDLIVRDKSIRVLQYGSKLLMGYFHESLNHQSTQLLQNIWQSASTSRKLFRILKSINSLNSLIDISGKSHSSTLDTVLKSLEQICWTFYYIFDNASLCSRLNIVRWDNASIETKSQIFWFGADIFKFSYALLQWGKHIRARYVKDVSAGDIIMQCYSNLETRALTYCLFKSCLDVFVSGNKYWRALISTKICSTPRWEGNVGLCAVISSCLSIYDIYCVSKPIKDYPSELSKDGAGSK